MDAGGVDAGGLDGMKDEERAAQRSEGISVARVQGRAGSIAPGGLQGPRKRLAHARAHARGPPKENLCEAKVLSDERYPPLLCGASVHGSRKLQDELWDEGRGRTTHTRWRAFLHPPSSGP